MLIEIRVVIHVPDEDKKKFSVAIERITDAIYQEFPNLKKSIYHSPITVSIKEMPDHVWESV